MSIEASQSGEGTFENPYRLPFSKDQLPEEYIVCYADRFHEKLDAEGIDETPLEKKIDGVSRNVFGAYGNPGYFSELFERTNNLQYVEDMYDELLEQTGKPVHSFSREKRIRMAAVISESLGTTLRGMPYNTDKDFFEKTNVARRFISGPKMGVARSQNVEDNALAKVFFCMPIFQYGNYGVNMQTSEKAQEYLKSKINGKKIVLFGGGSSIQDLVYDDENFQPEMIVNVDPHEIFVHGDTSTPNPYARVKALAEDVDIQSKLKEYDCEQVDEIWASFSVPYYIRDPDKIRQMFENAKSLLAPGGTLRIYPFNIAMIGGASLIPTDIGTINLNEERFKAVHDTVLSINDDIEFNVALVNTSGIPGSATLLIQRVTALA